MVSIFLVKILSGTRISALEELFAFRSQLALWLGFDVPCAQKRLGLPGRLAASNFVAVILAELVRQRSGPHRVALGEWFNVALLACDSLRNSSSKSWGFTPQEQLAYVKWCTAVGIPRFVCGDLLRNAKDVCKFIEVLVHSFPDTVKGTFL